MISIFQKKQSIHFEAFLRLLISKLLTATKLNIESIDEAKILSKDEIKIANEEIIPFRLVVLSLLLSNIGKYGKKHYSSEEINKSLVIALRLAYQDIGLSKNDALITMQKQVDRMSQYFVGISTISEEEIKEKGTYFFITVQYPQFVLKEKIDFSREDDRNKNFILFDVAKQVYCNDEKHIPKLVKEFKFIEQ